MKFGQQGPRGRDGQASSLSTNTPGSTPTTPNCDVVWPPGDGTLPVGVTSVIDIIARCSRNDTGTRRTMTARVYVAAPSVLPAEIDGVQTGIPLNSANWTGAAAISFSLYATSNGTKLRIQGAGPPTIPSTWAVSGALVSILGGL